MATDREQFGAEELAICLSHYDLGIITSIQEFARGSRRSPKIIIDCQRGRFLFKRRVRGREDAAKVAFTHQIQLLLAAQNFPLPHLLGTRPENNSMLVLSGSIYEMFEYISGTGYDASLEATHSSGKILGLFHKLLTGFKSEYKPPTGSYHNQPAIQQSIRNSIRKLPEDKRPSDDVMTDVVESLDHAYKHCAAQANGLGLEKWGVQIVHGDWHPGNMLFRDKHVVAVIDYDTARLQQRVIDLANGALQHSIIGGGDDPTRWPEYVDETRFKRFLRGYDSVNVVSVAELKAVPFLMCEAMIAEAVLPIAATGSFGRMEGFPFLQMIDRKVKWILSHLNTMQKALE